MAAHAGTIGIGTRRSGRSWTRRLAALREGIRRRRLDRAGRAHCLRVNGARLYSIRGSEHSHLMLPPKAY